MYYDLAYERGCVMHCDSNYTTYYRYVIVMTFEMHYVMRYWFTPQSEASLTLQTNRRARQSSRRMPD